jgi:serine protease Do
VPWTDHENPSPDCPDAMKVAEISKDIPQNVNFAIRSGTLVNFLESNRVSYKSDLSAADMPPADLADHARAMSAQIICEVTNKTLAH